MKYIVDLINENRKGANNGIYSVCSAQPLVIEAAIRQAIIDDAVVLIEATANQVNQFGGYTSMKPDDFISPVNEYRISQHFNKDDRHQGIDLAAPAGTPVYAVQNGTVIYSGTQKGYGNLIIIEHTGRVMTVYAHNEKNIASAGEKVKRGDQIATVGNTGRSTGNHLHFEIRQEGVAVDPAPFISKIGR